MPSTVIGALRVNLSADSAEFKRNMTDAERIAERFGNQIGSSLRRQIVAFGAAAAAAAGPAAIGLLLKSSIETVSAQVDLANRVGASVAAIQTLEHAAELSGASTEALGKALGLLNQRLGQAAREGAGPAADALHRLGLSAQELSSMDADQRVLALSDRMKELGYSTQQQADTLRDLGIRQQEIINLFIEGSATIEEARNNLKSWGVLLSDIDASKVEQAGDAWDKIQMVLTGVGNQLAVQVAPIIAGVADYIGNAASETNGFHDEIKSVLEYMLHLFGALQRAVYDFRISFDEAGASVTSWGKNVDDTVFGWLEKMGVETKGLRWEFVEDIDKKFGHLKETLAKPPSDEERDQWLAKWNAKLEAQAKATIANKPKVASSDDDQETEAQKKQLEKYQAHLQTRLAALQDSILSERDQQLAQYEQNLSDLEDFHDKGLLSDEEYRKALVENSAQNAEKLKQIDESIARDRERAQKLQERAMYDTADNILSVLDSVFKDSKAVAVAHAIINTAQAVTKSLAEYGATPWGLAAAATAAAAGAAEIATILSTSSKGSGGRGGGSGGGSSSAAATTASQPATPAGPTQTLFVSGINPGQLYSGEALRALMQALVDAQRDGAKLVLDRS